MKMIGRLIRLALLLTTALALSSRAAEPAKSSASSIPVYDMPALQKLDALPMRKIVGVHFNYRHKDIQHLKPNWYYGTIWHIQQGSGKDRLDHVSVMVSKADLAAFKALPTDFRSGADYVVYGQILKDTQSALLFLRLVGTKMKKDSTGKPTFTW
jgi:hypothetical protein